MNATDAGIRINGQNLTADQLLRVARSDAGDSPSVLLDDKARSHLAEVRRYVEEHWLSSERGSESPPIYGFNTGVGALKGLRIREDELQEFQNLYIRAHCVGVGPDFDEDVVRAAILLRANSLAAGFSGVRPAMLDALLDLLNRRIHPSVPQKGSLGASGDLAPLAHIGAVLIGEPEARVGWPGGQGTVADLRQAIPTWSPIALHAKEAMALAIGTSFMLALAVLLIADATRCLQTADLVAALSLEAVRGEPDAFDGRLISLRPQPGQQISAANVRDLVAGSGLLGTHPAGEPRVQDAYSLRCVPQVHGATRDALHHARDVAERELNAVTDNPLLFPEAGAYRALSGGNFHGQPLALALDFAGLALSELGSISERRLFRMLTSNLSYGLPENLTGGEAGRNTGFMIMQYTAASLVAENKLLCQPASADSIPSSGDQEDHVSMGIHAGIKAHTILRNVEEILAMECLAACQGIDLTARALGISPPLGKGTLPAFRAFRAAGIPALQEDRYLKPDIDRAIQVIRNGDLLRASQQEGLGLRD